MPKKPEGSFNPMTVPGLSSKAREAVKDVFDAMSVWRNEVSAASESNSQQVLDKMAKAAAALGWPEQVVDAARAQMQSVGEMHIKTMDHIIGAWEEQLKSANPMAAMPSAMLSKLNAMRGLGPAGPLPGADALQAAATAPLQMWMEFGKQWQQFWLDSLNKSGRR